VADENGGSSGAELSSCCCDLCCCTVAGQMASSTDLNVIEDQGLDFVALSERLRRATVGSQAANEK